MKELDLGYPCFKTYTYFFKVLIFIRASGLIIFPKILPAKFAVDIRLAFVSLSNVQ